MARWKPRVEHAFIVIGLGLLAGAAAAYEIGVRRPQSWPRTEAEVVSSRVINPKGPNTYSPEIGFRYTAGDQVRNQIIVGNWSSSSYSIVRSYVDGYPVGRRVSVAVNPADAEDIRHELGATFTNLFAPGVLATLALIFGGIGVIVTRRSASRVVSGSVDDASTSAHLLADGHRIARRIGMTFVAIGVLSIGLGLFFLRAEMNMQRDWPTVDATAIASRVIPVASTSSSARGSRQLYDTEVTFRYIVEGITYVSTTSSGIGTSSRSAAAARAARFSPGSAHVIKVRPDDANIIRFDLDRISSEYWLSAGMLAMGLVFAGLGGLVWRFTRHGQAATVAMPDIEMEDRFGPRT